MILAAGAVIILVLSLLRTTPDERPKIDSAPLVRTVTAQSAPYRFTVTSQGEVSPGKQGDLIPQVSGEVVWVSPSLEAGGFFEEGEALARIDPADYRVERETARAAVARAESEFSRAKKERDRQQTLGRQSVASEARIDDATNAYRIAEASRREAQARLEKANRDLARTELKAPYRGRVRSEQVDIGQFVTRGASIGRIYSVDYAEVRLPLPDRELAFLDLPLLPDLNAEQADTSNAPPPSVTLEARFAGEMHRWSGQLVRTEAELDPQSRMINVVARVAEPYGQGEGRTAPLAVGLFVEATIEGESVDRAFVLPRDAIREGNRVYIVDSESKLRFRDVDVLRVQRENAILLGGLEDGEQICISPLQAAIDGMSLRVMGGEAKAAKAPAAATPSSASPVPEPAAAPSSTQGEGPSEAPSPASAPGPPSGASAAEVAS